MRTKFISPEGVTVEITAPEGLEKEASEIASRVLSGAPVVTYQEKRDPVVEAVIAKLRQRSKIGVETYGTTLEENNHDDFLVHLQEELMDAVNYIQKLINQRNGR